MLLLVAAQIDVSFWDLIWKAHLVDVGTDCIQRLFLMWVESPGGQ